MRNNALSIRKLLANLERANEPIARGDPYPPFDPLHINIKRIPDNMRDKYIDATLVREGDDSNGVFLEFYWKTQEDFDKEDFEKFIEEVKRCVNYNIDYYDISLSSPITLLVTAISRFGSEYGHGQITLFFESDTFIESLDTKDIYYYGFIGGDAGNYFDGDYFEIFKHEDGSFGWRDCELSYTSGDKKFNSRRQARADAIKTMKPDDGSKFIVSKDPDELYDKIYPEMEESYPEDIL